MIVAGEASGDELGAELARDLRKLDPNVALFGAAGPGMRIEGVEPVFESDNWSVVGLAAVAKAVPKFLRIKSELRQIANMRKPAAVILIDFPELNLKLARDLKADGHRVIYYVSPQVWAWREYRVRSIRDNVDLLLSILPFEKEWYKARGVVHIEYVGNPVARRVRPRHSRRDFCGKHSLDPLKKIIALLPGSRRREVSRHLKVMLESSVELSHENPSINFVVAAANDAASRMCEAMISDFRSRVDGLNIFVVNGETIDVLNSADAAAVASGTATLEAGVLGTPMVVVYKVPRIDAALFRPFINVPHFALINLVAGKRVVAELIQEDLTPSNLGNELDRLLDDDVNRNLRQELKEVTSELRSCEGRGAAEAIVRFLEEARSATV